MPHLTSTVHRLLSERLLRVIDVIIASYPFLGFVLFGENKVAHSISEHPIGEAKNPSSK